MATYGKIGRRGFFGLPLRSSPPRKFSLCQNDGFQVEEKCKNSTQHKEPCTLRPRYQLMSSFSSAVVLCCCRTGVATPQAGSSDMIASFAGLLGTTVEQSKSSKLPQTANWISNTGYISSLITEPWRGAEFPLKAE